MNKVTLRLKQDPAVPLEAECICPDSFAEKSHAEICEQILYHGKRRLRLDEFFDVDGERSDQIEIHGELNKVRWIGRAMSRGRIEIRGNVGMHLGAYMSGGSIALDGDAGDWLGAEMKQGRIQVRGDAGGQIGAGYRGSLFGMRGGLIHVTGRAGLEVGMRMRRGTIVIGDVVRDFAGLQMKGGTIVMQSGAEIRTGAWMQRGTIISLKPLELMPTFRSSGSYNPTFMNVYARELRGCGVEIPYEPEHGRFTRFCGDAAVPGKGEILVWQGVS